MASSRGELSLLVLFCFLVVLGGVRGQCPNDSEDRPFKFVGAGESCEVFVFFFVVLSFIVSLSSYFFKDKFLFFTHPSPPHQQKSREENGYFHMCQNFLACQTKSNFDNDTICVDGGLKV